MAWLKNSFWSLWVFSLCATASAQIIPNQMTCDDPGVTRTLEKLRKHDLKLRDRQGRILAKARTIDTSIEWQQHLQFLESGLQVQSQASFRPATQHPRVKAVILSNRESIALQQMKTHADQLKWALSRQVREHARHRRDLQNSDMPLNLQVLETFTSYQTEREEVRQVAKRFQSSCLKAGVLKASLERKTASVPQPQSRSLRGF